LPQFGRCTAARHSSIAEARARHSSSAGSKQEE
jgi:hypothetical protein